MALIIKDRVQETSTTSGTGTLTLAGAVTGYQSFASAIGSGNTTYYGIYETLTSNWEVGIGTVGTGTLARTTVLASSNAGSLVSFGGAQLAVWGDMPAAKGLYTDYVGTVSGLSIGGNAATATTSTNLAGGSQYAFPYQSASNSTAFLSAGTSGSVLITTGTFGPPAWLAQSSMTVGTATNIAGGSAGEIPFQTGSGATSFSAVGTAGQVLTSQGTGTPTWTTPTTGTPGGSNTQVQYNNSGAFGGSSAFTFDGTTNTAPVQNASYGFFLNPTTIATSYTIPSGYNAHTAGKVTINTGVTVTVSTGSRWVVV
jgi:hypothetical protein